MPPPVGACLHANRRWTMHPPQARLRRVRERGSLLQGLGAPLWGLTPVRSPPGSPQARYRHDGVSPGRDPPMDIFPCAQTLASAPQLAKAEIHATRCLGRKPTEQIHWGKGMIWGVLPGSLATYDRMPRKQSISINFDQIRSTAIEAALRVSKSFISLFYIFFIFSRPVPSTIQMIVFVLI